MSKMRDSDSCSGSDAGLNRVSRGWNTVGGGVVGFIHHLSSSAGLHFFPLRCHTPVRSHPDALIFDTQTSAIKCGTINNSKCSASADSKVTPNFFFFCRRGFGRGRRGKRECAMRFPFAVTQRRSTQVELESRRKAQTLLGTRDKIFAINNVAKVAKLKRIHSNSSDPAGLFYSKEKIPQ